VSPLSEGRVQAAWKGKQFGIQLSLAESDTRTLTAVSTKLR